jgi:hypothetical protein
LIAAQSWERQDYGNGDIIAPRGKPGRFFIDLYEVSSGPKMGCCRGHTSGRPSCRFATGHCVLARIPLLHPPAWFPSRTDAGV